MTVAIKQENVFTEIGPGAILHGFFSTICATLENGVWGSHFPKLMNELYQGKLGASDLHAAKDEMSEVISQLKTKPIEGLVWDIEDPNIEVPSEYDKSQNRSSLYEYFKTTTGRNLAFEIADNIDAALEFGGDVEIVSYENISDTVHL